MVRLLTIKFITEMNPYMNSYLVSLIVIALYLAYALLLLLIRALIVRSDQEQKERIGKERDDNQTNEMI